MKTQLCRVAAHVLLTSYRYLASLGALITVLTLSVDTFVQNAVKVVYQNDTTDGSYVYRTNSFSFSSYFDRGVGMEIPPSAMLVDLSYAMNQASNVSSAGLFQQDLAIQETAHSLVFSHWALTINVSKVKSPRTVQLSFILQIRASTSNTTMVWSIPPQCPGRRTRAPSKASAR